MVISTSIQLFVITEISENKKSSIYQYFAIIVALQIYLLGYLCGAYGLCLADVATRLSAVGQRLQDLPTVERGRQIRADARPPAGTVAGA